MARTDESINKLLKNKENFAYLFNATVFQGEQVIKADKLTEINTEDVHIDTADTIEGKELNVVQKYRDLRMQYEDEMLQVVLGCEDQSKIDYSMPIRTMLYDALAYTKQQNDLELKQSKSGKFYRGKMTKRQKVLPVLSIVFYYGEKEWDAGKSIHELIKWPEDSRLKDIIPDYKMNLIWAYGIKDIDKFTTDLQYILYLLKYKQDEIKLEDYIRQNDEKLKCMGKDSQNAVIALMGSDILRDVEKEEGEVQMGSKALDAIHERGIKRGIERGQILKQIMLVQKKMERGDTVTKISDDLLEEEKDIENLYKVISEHPEATADEIYEIISK